MLWEVCCVYIFVCMKIVFCVHILLYKLFFLYIFVDVWWKVLVQFSEFARMFWEFPWKPYTIHLCTKTSMVTLMFWRNCSAHHDRDVTLYIHTYIYVYIRTYTYMSYIYICKYVYYIQYVRKYMYIFIYIYIYICTIYM